MTGTRQGRGDRGAVMFDGDGKKKNNPKTAATKKGRKLKKINGT